MEKGEKSDDDNTTTTVRPMVSPSSSPAQSDSSQSGMAVQDSTTSYGDDTVSNQDREERIISGAVVPPAPEPPTHIITFWRNGFSVDNGPLRLKDVPQNVRFLEDIMENKCPEELYPAEVGTQVLVSFERRDDEDYIEPQNRDFPFRGVGRTLGSSSSDDRIYLTVASPRTPIIAPAPLAGLVVEQNAPTTSIQIRLADGTRMVSRFNYHHTVGDIREFINASRPGTPTTYMLQVMGFPPTPLLDSNQTIEQAGIASSVIIQKF